MVDDFKISEAQARALVLDGNRHVVKKDLDERRAKRYQAALEEAGLVVHMEPMESQETELTLVPLELKPARVTESRTTASTPPSTTGTAPSRCPACGSLGIVDGVCRNCGVVREKYLARQETSEGSSHRHADSDAHGSDPYATLRANPSPPAEKGKMRGSAKIRAAHGWSWITRGFWHFRTHPFAWVLAFIVLLAIYVALGLAPFAGSLVTGILSAVFTGGLMHGAQEQERGISPSRDD